MMTMKSNSDALDLLVAAESDQIRKRLARMMAESDRIRKQLTKDSRKPELDRFGAAVAAESDQIRKRLEPMMAEPDRIKKQHTKSMPADSNLAKEQRANLTKNRDYCRPCDEPNQCDEGAGNRRLSGSR